MKIVLVVVMRMVVVLTIDSVGNGDDSVDSGDVGACSGDAGVLGAKVARGMFDG